MSDIPESRVSAQPLVNSARTSSLVGTEVTGLKLLESPSPSRRRGYGRGRLKVTEPW